MKSFQSKCPVRCGSSVDQDENIAEATDQETVLENDVHVYGIKMLVFHPIKRPTTVGFASGYIREEGNSPPNNYSLSRLT
jgi:hypothetical protein